ncbi:hypothetical protein H6F43_03515 [Leptolyngbya sp. FACHB-36]|uniref:hypothetical protein n=1 Tax=Leptolyngbya sp. FACHB-36 TaxID=2692808 RepID=UPI0016806622|nr:hypothetical protein [Leptolyngbya sp. FACHB-36]MBD2019250.1 hypothetical protein [Leptolyngbya sp. FACHB-36]
MHIIKYIQVYPDGYADPERLAHDPDYQPGKFGPVEDYEIRQADSAPQIGEVIDGWIVVQIDHYQPQNDEWHFCTAICTLDGKIPKRHDWSSPGAKVLTFFLEGSEITRNEDGSAIFELSDRPNHEAELVFKPQNGRPVAGYDYVMAVQTASSLVAA